MSGQTNGGVFNPKNLNMFGYTYNNPVNLVDPDGNNPGPVYIKGPLAQIDLQSGNAAIDNTVLGAVNTLFNFSNSFVNAGLNALNAYGEAIEPHEAAIQSVASGVGPYGSVVGAAILLPAKASKIGELGRKIVSDGQVAELLSGKGKAIVGAGTDKKLRAAPRLANEYGGDAGDWAKIKSSNQKHTDGYNQETHAYQNTKTDEIVEMKTKLEGH